MFFRFGFGSFAVTLTLLAGGLCTADAPQLELGTKPSFGLFQPRVSAEIFASTGESLGPAASTFLLDTGASGALIYPPATTQLAENGFQNEGEFIGQTLEAIFSQKAPTPFEVIVLDSGSTDQTLKILGNYDVRVEEIPAEDFSFGGALNRGVELAQGEIIVNLSAHCIAVNKYWLERLTLPII